MMEIFVCQVMTCDGDVFCQVMKCDGDVFCQVMKCDGDVCLPGDEA